MRACCRTRGTTLVELMITLSIVSAVGLILYGLLNTNMVLGARNTAVNTAHQQARVAMLQMVQDLHSTVSQPQLTNVDPTTQQAAGISFQLWSAGPWKIVQDVTTGATVRIWASTAPTVGQRLVVPTHQIEDNIVAVQNLGLGFYDVTLANYLGWPNPQNPDGTNPAPITNTMSTLGDITCFITDPCAYNVVNITLLWTKPGATGVMGNDITNATPFSIPTTPGGAPYTRFVAAIDLSTADLAYSNRGYKSANILLNGQVPYKARLTTYTGATPTPTP